MPDAILIEKARRGDTAAFETLVRRHYRAAFAVALAVLGNRMDAEDVTQDAFLRALERLDELRQAERFAAWLLQIVRNRARNFHSYRRVRAAQPLETIEAISPDRADRELERGRLRDRLESALAEISEVQRQVVLLHDLEGWKHSEIADSLGLSETMSRQHLFNARRVLRARLGSEVAKEYIDE
ncbi:MAG: RNA polymerase sigma factor [Gemmatimonadota bacterium]|nr:MAG: RNA polymerase sigma factor [Gemmatimonadota bacterium]